MSLPVLYVVAVALCDGDGRVLLAQRPMDKDMGGLWEFPGGKIHEGERPEQALVREMEEELGLTVKEEDLLPLTFASHTYERFHLFMPLYLCRRWQGAPHPMEGQSIVWVRPDAFPDYPMPPADGPLSLFLQQYADRFWAD